MKGIKLSIPYLKRYSEKPDDQSRQEVALAIEAAKKTVEPIDFDMLLVLVKSPVRPRHQNIIAHIFYKAVEHGEIMPKGVFIDWKKSPENVIEIRADQSYFI